MMGGTRDVFRDCADFTFVKRESGPRIKSEFEPSLDSFPMAPPKLEKNEYMEDRKSVLTNIPEARRPAGRARRRRFYTSSLVHRVDGFHIRAHYGKGKVDFTITKQSNKTRELNWKEIEQEMFRKLHRARFHFESTTEPGVSFSAFCSDPFISTLQFSLLVRPVQKGSQLPGTHNTVSKQELKDEKGNGTSGLILSSAAPVSSVFDARHQGASLQSDIPIASIFTEEFAGALGVQWVGD